MVDGNSPTENIDQYEACDRILKYALSAPNKWLGPREIKDKFLSTVPLAEVSLLFDLIAITFPQPAKIRRNTEYGYWEITPNNYTEEFLKDGGFAIIWNSGLSTKNILFVAAAPSDESRIRIDLELRKVTEKLQASQFRDYISLQVRTAAKPQSLAQAILELTPEVIHFSGHGTPQGVMMEDENGNSILFPVEKMNTLFGLFKESIRCVILNSCYSAEQARIISAHGIYVVGMNEAIEDDEAINFAVGFYQAIGANKDYPFAYKIGLINMNYSNDKPVFWKNGEVVGL